MVQQNWRFDIAKCVGYFSPLNLNANSDMNARHEAWSMC
jgi:hypothetical protein